MGGSATGGQSKKRWSIAWLLRPSLFTRHNGFERDDGMKRQKGSRILKGMISRGTFPLGQIPADTDIIYEETLRWQRLPVQEIVLEMAPFIHHPRHAGENIHCQGHFYISRIDGAAIPIETALWNMPTPEPSADPGCSP